MDRRDMSTALHGLFVKGIEVNLNTEEFTIIKLATNEKTPCKHFSDWVNIFIEEGNVHPDDVEKVKNVYNLENIKRVCGSSSAPRACHYRRKDANGDWEDVALYYLRSCKWTPEDPTIVLGVMPLNWLWKN